MPLQLRQAYSYDIYSHLSKTHDYGFFTHRAALRDRRHVQSPLANDMTVGIAAVADSGTSIVLCSDQLATHRFLSWAVETDNPDTKIHYIDESSAIVAAGNLDFAKEIVNCIRILHGAPEKWQAPFADKVRHAYMSVHRAKVEASCLNPRGLTFQTYIDNNAKLSPLLINAIDNDLTSFSMGVSLIAAECRDGGHSLALVESPGVVMESATGFLCIGEGAGHALYAMIEQGYDPRQPVSEVERFVRTAKVRSEKTRSVGAATTLCYLPRRKELPNVASPAPA